MMELLYLAGILALISYMGGRYYNCFDMSYGTVACLLKEIIKFYLFYTRAVHIQKVKAEASKKELKESEQPYSDSALRRPTVQHIIGPMLTGVSDLFETLYAGGSLAKGFVRGLGTFVGACAGGIAGEGKIGWTGFVAGSLFGSWIGGMIGLIAYDVANDVRLIIYAVRFFPYALKYGTTIIVVVLCGKIITQLMK